LFRFWSFVYRHATVVGILLLSIQVTLGALSMAGDSATLDEEFHIRLGSNLLAGTLEHADQQRMPITLINYLPQPVCRSLGIRVSDNAMLFICRVPTLIFAALTGWLVFCWSRRRHGVRGGLLSLAVYVFCPTVLAHGRLITNDTACTLLFFSATVSFSNYLRRPSWPRLLLVAGLVGLAQLAKQTSLLLFPLFLIILILRRWPLRGIAQPRRLGHAAVRGLVFLVLVVAIINAGYRFGGTGESLETHISWAHASYGYPESQLDGDGFSRHLKARVYRMPMPLPRVYVEAYLLGHHFNNTGLGHGEIYLLGKLRALGWKSYFPIAFLLKTPLPTLVFILAAVAVSLLTKRLNRASDELVCLLAATVVFSYFTLLCTAQIGVRYLLPMLPFLYVLVGRVVVSSPFYERRPWRVGVVAMLLWLGLSSLSYFPHYIPYFNEICWDRRYLYKYLADSNVDWDQGRRHLERYLQLHPGEVIPLNPPMPTAGTFIVNVNSLVGLDTSPQTYSLLREKHHPVAHVAYLYLIYNLPSTEMGAGAGTDP
jgi:hypothetical protein